jgi:hypothetical protein
VDEVFMHFTAFADEAYQFSHGMKNPLPGAAGAGAGDLPIDAWHATMPEDASALSAWPFDGPGPLPW